MREGADALQSLLGGQFAKRGQRVFHLRPFGGGEGFQGSLLLIRGQLEELVDLGGDVLGFHPGGGVGGGLIGGVHHGEIREGAVIGQKFLLQFRGQLVPFGQPALDERGQVFGHQGQPGGAIRRGQVEEGQQLPA